MLPIPYLTKKGDICMPKTLVAKGIKSINPLIFRVENDKVTGCLMNVDVNYGELGLVHQSDIWYTLTTGEQHQVQQVYDILHQKAVKHFLE